MDKDTSPFKMQNGDIIDALNMSIAEYGGSSAGVYKPIKGTNFITNGSGVSFSANDRVIGAAADPSRDRVYFFVKRIGSASGSGIYMCSNVSGTPVVSRVFINSVLNLQNSDFVKVDVINADFSQDGSINTMLYFTDNVNEPRRINVDRAIAGQYSTHSTEDLKYMLSVCKAAPINVPTFRFDTEANLYDNNMNGNCFQFALQYIYEDGEESAISSYSKLAYNRYTASETDDASASMRYRDNVCLIDLSRVNTTTFPAPQSLINGSTSTFPISSVSKLRLLGRNGNAGAFFVIDEFDPDKNLERYINGSLKTVYGFGQKIYRFYNDGLYSPVSTDDVNKLYDNVPLLAVGQCIAGNRLMYSNYKEGRPNVDVSSGTLTPVYSAEPAIGNINTPSQNPTVVSTESVDSKERIIINLTSTGGFPSTNTSIPSGSAVNLSFKFKPSANITRIGSLPSVYTFKYTVEDSNGEKLDVYMDSPTQNFPASNVESEIYISFTTEQDMTVGQVRDKIKDLISEKKVVVESEVSNSKTHTVIASNTNHVLHDQQVTVSPTIGYTDFFDVEWSLNDIQNGATDDTFYIYPYISNIVHKPTDDPGNPLVRILTLDNGQSTEDYYVTVIGSSLYQNMRQSVSGVDYSFTSISNIAYDDIFSCVGLSYTQSFKAGCTHEIGVVYYDKYNRSGNVNVIGSFYALPFGHSGRGGKNGPTSVNVNLSNVPVPSWASRFQLVYPGPSTYESFLTYTTGGGYVKRSSTNAVDTDHKFVYVSLKTLELYAKEKSSIRSYSFTPGDKLRVVSYGDTLTYADVQERQSGGSYTSTDATMDFNIVGLEVLSATNNPIIGNDTANADQYYGDFLVLEAPETTANPPTKKYLGFDWHVVSQQNYANGNTPSADNWWGKRSVVEILTPKRQTSEKIYYEIGESYEFTQKTANANVEHQLVTTNQGNVHMRSVPCKTAILSGVTWNVGSPSGWKYVSRPIESMSVSDIKTMNDWSMGRPQVRYEKAKTKSEFNGIVYSDAYEQDVLKNSLSSFNPSLANFHYVERAYGSLNYLYSLGDRVVSIQQHKVGLSGVNKGVINYADGSANVSMSTDVIGPTGYLSGDFGCGDMYKGIFGLNNAIFFFDPIRRKVIRFSEDQAYVISDNGMASYFEGLSLRGYVSGYDPLEDMYYITFELSDDTFDTVGYSLAESNWISRYTFHPNMYQNLGSKMISFKKNTGDRIAWIHNNEMNRCYFYGGYSDDKYQSIGIKAVCNISPSSVKVFNSMSVEGKNPRRPFMNVGLISAGGLELKLSTDTGNVSVISEFPTYREGSWFYEIKPGKFSGNRDYNSTYETVNEFITNADIKWLGKPASISEEQINGSYHTTVFFNNRVLDLDLIVGDWLYTTFANQISTASAILSQINSDGSLVFTSTNPITLNTSDNCLLRNQVMNSFNGERPRGKYAIMDLHGLGTDADTYQDPSSNPIRNIEIYCINVNVSDSKDHHDGGQNE
jgi:hypothetical protein